MTRWTLPAPGEAGMDAGVRAVVAGGEPDKVASGGLVVATLQLGFWRERARAVVDGAEWVFGKESGDLGARLSVDPEGTTRMRAVRTSFWTSRHDVDLEGVLVQVQGGARNRVWTSDGATLGTSGRVGFWSPVPTLELRDDVPLRHVVFLLWLEHTFTRRNQAAAAA
ncbi:hypothetical protein [Klenkia terrae]|uniref:Uncharacterized protein n=1 Tax=Klenkia terrae TaxID=1052259 RepID=A0ABU8E6F4_9ACTN|nr:hypothetical protein [Klenkia terrae]SSC22018.1 Hypothetical protein KLENKIAIHU_596 [Klenkia terrae]